MNEEERFIALETRLSYLDATVQDLNAVITAQQQQLQAMERLCALMGERLARMGQDLYKGTAADEVPPHY
ncbi:SlyX protein [Solimonas aquatica]|uniref:SlyX protein n=1 Tax=Solimonas aquatica TaxID=489703 RepID=A0A1H9K388_9GAMM|nr:SlyX family protein [Solimonas aquatica]SEQ93437.1 SlyX protein [Solimonas aquatica]